MKKRIYLSLGANMGDRHGNLRNAIAGLNELGDVVAASSMYETEPVEVDQEQSWFLNCAVAVDCELDARDFLDRILSMELAMGRVRMERRGPRPLDIDIIFFGNEVMDLPGLIVPHPAMQSRRFVLAPLAEIAPSLVHPLFRKSVQQLLEALSPASGVVRKLEESPE